MATATEQHFTPQQVAEMWNLSEDKVRETGVAAVRVEHGEAII